MLLYVLPDPDRTKQERSPPGAGTEERQASRMVWMTPNAVHLCPSTCFPVIQIHICYAGQSVQRGHLSSPEFCPVKVAAGPASILAVFNLKNPLSFFLLFMTHLFSPSLLTGPSVSILTLRHTFPPVASHMLLS